MSSFMSCRSTHSHGRLQYVQTDVSSFDEQQAAFKAAIAFSPTHSLDFVIANAGVAGEPILPSIFPPDLPPGADLPHPVTKVLDVNLMGAYYTAVLALHYFRATRIDRTGIQPQTTPHLLFVCSVAGYLDGVPLGATYSAAKWGIRGIFKSLRPYQKSLGGVRINMIAPWWIETPIVGFAGPLKELGVRMAEIEDFVEGALRLCCDQSAHGRCVVVAPKKMQDSRVGSGNFDIGDDAAGLDSFTVMAAKLRDGTFFDGEPFDIGKFWGYE